jgi:hypothetical protein
MISSLRYTMQCGSELPIRGFVVADPKHSKCLILDAQGGERQGMGRNGVNIRKGVRPGGGL